MFSRLKSRKIVFRLSMLLGCAVIASILLIHSRNAVNLCNATDVTKDIIHCFILTRFRILPISAPTHSLFELQPHTYCIVYITLATLQVLNHPDSIIVPKLACTNAIAIKTILLPSAVCKFSCGNISRTIRILLNTGSQVTLISDTCL